MSYLYKITYYLPRTVSITEEFSAKGYQSIIVTNLEEWIAELPAEPLFYNWVSLIKGEEIAKKWIEMEKSDLFYTQEEWVHITREFVLTHFKTIEIKSIEIIQKHQN